MQEVRAVGQTGRKYSGCSPGYLSLVHVKGLAGHSPDHWFQEAEAGLNLTRSCPRLCLQMEPNLGGIEMPHLGNQDCIDMSHSKCKHSGTSASQGKQGTGQRSHHCSQVGGDGWQNYA